ncbi:MAG: hypothetical protein LUP97_06260 [Methanoregula sp.]|nr:hypothetical protein [Methanoregula sp.]
MSLLSFITALTSTPETSPRLDPNPAYGVMAALLGFATHIRAFERHFRRGGGWMTVAVAVSMRS